MPVRRVPTDQLAAEGKPLLGFVRDAANPNLWRPFTDETIGLQADLDGVVFGSTRDECLQALELKFPPTEHGLTRVSLYKYQRWTSKLAEWDPGDSISVKNADAQHYNGDDHITALTLAKRHGSITCDLGTEEARKFDWAKAGCKIVGNGSHWYARITHISYDPKGVLKSTRAAKTRAANRCAKVSEVGTCAWKMRTEMYDTGFNFSLSYNTNSKFGAIALFLKVIPYFNFMYGKNAHRRHPEFRALKDLWKKQPERAYKFFAPTGRKYYESADKDLVMFRNFMDSEVAVKNTKLHKGKWIPRVKLMDFTRYDGKHYARNKRKVAQMATKKTSAKGAKSAKPAKKATKKAKSAKKPAAKPAKKPAPRVRVPRQPEAAPPIETAPQAEAPASTDSADNLA